MRQLGAHLPEPPAESTPASSRGLEALPLREGRPWSLLDDEPRPHFPFFTIAVPALAAVLAVGALFWSGALRDRVHQQDQVMTALQQQNKKLADTVEEMTVEQKAAAALQSAEQGTGPHTPDAQARDAQPSQQPAAPTTPASPIAQTSAPVPATVQPPAQAAAVTSSPASTAPQPAPTNPPAASGSPGQRPGPMEGIARRYGSRPEMGVRVPQHAAEHAPEIVPPYPTLNASGSASRTASDSVTAPPAATAAGTPGAATPPTTSSGAGNAAAQARPSSAPAATYPRSNVASSSPATPTYPTPAPLATPAVSTLLAQNIEAVQALQRHSTVPLREFHVQEGMLTKVTPLVGLSVRRPDPGTGTYTLVVTDGRTGYQMKGQANNPLVFTDNSTHREYELVVLRIANQQIYGYVRPTQ